MPNPKLIQETPLTLVEVKEALKKIEEQNKELNYRSNKTKEYLHTFVELPQEKKKELYQKLTSLKLIRLKEPHLIKIIDFLPQTAEELKVVLQAYPLTLLKKDMESIVTAVKGVIK